MPLNKDGVQTSTAMLDQSGFGSNVNEGFFTPPRTLKLVPHPQMHSSDIPSTPF